MGAQMCSTKKDLKVFLMGILKHGTYGTDDDSLKLGTMPLSQKSMCLAHAIPALPAHLTNADL